MSMTQAETIRQLETLRGHYQNMMRNMREAVWVQSFEEVAQDIEAIDLVLTTLRGPTREMVERMRYPWERIIDAYGNTEGFLCECGHMDNSASNFCKYCGMPKTDEAVDILWQRWKEAVDNDN